jgi:hypothetical protein
MSEAPGKAERKYLAAHSEPEARLSEAFESVPRRYGHVLVIPASGEGPELAHALSSVPEGPLGPVLTIVVVNATPDAPTSVHEVNAQTLADFARRGDDSRVLAPNARLHAHGRGSLLVLDRATHEHRLPVGQGVGLARKVGTDLALALVLSDRVASSWIHVSDADVVFPGDYFHQVVDGEDAGLSARVYRFRHLPDGAPRSYDAALQYEATLRYYVLGLRFAGSPYAHHSIGSTLAVDAGAYAQVRGFPRRMAAEDFYLLNKLAKVGRVAPLSGAPLGLSSRASQRVPFGTGAAIARMLDERVSERTTYHPELFHHLRVWLATLEGAIAQRAANEKSGCNLVDSVREHSETDSAVDPETLLAALERTGVLAAANDALAAPVRAVRRQVHEAFDGFRTLKLLHALRDSGLPDLPLREALGRAAFLALSEDTGRMPTGELASRIEALDYVRSTTRCC